MKARKRCRKPRAGTLLDEIELVFPSVYDEYWYGLIFWV